MVVLWEPIFPPQIFQVLLMFIPPERWLVSPR